MKETWLYKWLKYQHEEVSIGGGNFTSGFMENLVNIIVVPLCGFVLIILGLLSTLLLPLYLFKDLYDLYYYINAEKIAKKEAIKKALELKTKIENWIHQYEHILNSKKSCYLEKITYEEKPIVEKLPGVNCGYLGNVGVDNYNYFNSYDRQLLFGTPIRSNSYSRHKKPGYKTIKEKLTVQDIESKHLTYFDFIVEFFKTYNLECDTIETISNKQICDIQRRRSLHDIYLITKYYYPKVTFIDIIEVVIKLLNSKKINCQYCSTVQKYVFYNRDQSNHNSFDRSLEFSNQSILFQDLKTYIENEK